MGFLHNVLESPSLIRSYRNHSISLFQSKIGFGNVITSLGIHLVPLCLDRKYDLARVQRRSDQVFGRLRDVERLGRAILLVLLGFLGVAGGVLTIRISVCTCVLLEQGDDDLINNMQ